MRARIVLACLATVASVSACGGPPTKEEIRENTTTFPTAQPQATQCTMDAKLCPDGSYVGRVPPSCQFAPCP